MYQKLRSFLPWYASAETQAGCTVSSDHPVYHIIRSNAPIEFRRKALGLKPAVWWGLFTGGIHGRIESYDRDQVRLVPAMESFKL